MYQSIKLGDRLKQAEIRAHEWGAYFLEIRCQIEKGSQSAFFLKKLSLVGYISISFVVQ